MDALYSSIKSQTVSVPKMLAILAIVIVIVYLVYTYIYLPYSGEHICGGSDQCCHCSGNETMVAIPPRIKPAPKPLNPVKEVTSNDLSQTLMGL